MAEYVYPAIFHSNKDGSYTITYPNLLGCISEGKSLRNIARCIKGKIKYWIKVLLRFIKEPKHIFLRFTYNTSEIFVGVSRIAEIV